MKLTLPLLLLCCALAVAAPGPAADAAEAERPAALCATRIARRWPARCRLAAGPASADPDGVPLPTRSIDPALGDMPYDYYAAHDRVDLYASAEDAAQNKDVAIGQSSGFVYLAALGDLNVAGVHLVSTVRGYARTSGLQRATISDFHGLAFYRPPSAPFGWLAAGGICPRPRPSPDAPFSDHCYQRYRRVPLLDQYDADGIRWVRIGVGEWVDSRYVAEVYPDALPVDAALAGRLVDVDLAEQVVRAYQDGQLVYATIAATGRAGFWTRPGTFRVWSKLAADDMTGGSAGASYYFLERVPWVLYFDQARALHGTYWHDRFGQPQSHGCVNLSPTDAHWFFEFAQVGTVIHVWDPSGQTPTEPAAYGPGGA
jgi:hypothetical protein